MRDRILVRFVLATALCLGIGLPAHALTLSGISAVWPEDQVRFQSGFVPANLFQVSSGAGQQLIWFGPEQTANDGASLSFRRRSLLPLTLPVDPSNQMTSQFAVGSIQYKNFPTTTKGPIDLALDLTLSFTDLATQTIRIPFEINHTNDDVLNIGSCPAGSTTLCDDIVALLGFQPRTIPGTGGVTVTVLGFDRSPLDPEDNVAETSFLGPENQTGPQIDLLIKITVPEPATIALVGLALGGLLLGRRGARRSAPPTG